MPKIDETVLRHHIRDNTIEQVYLLYGNEQYLIRQYASRLCDKVCSGKRNAFNYHFFNGQSCNSADFIMEAQAFPFGAPRKCVAVEDFDFSSLSSKEQEQFDELLEDIPETTVIIFSQLRVPVDQRKKAWKALLSQIEKVGCTVELKKRDRNGLIRFLRTRASKKGVELSPELAQYMLELCGEDMFTLENELDKLCAYCGDGEVRRLDIDAVAIPLISADAFSMVRALLNGNYDRAYQLLDKLFYQRVEPTMLLGALASVYIDAYRVKAALAANGDIASLPEMFDYKNKEFKLRGAQRDFKGKSVEYVRRALELLLDTDIKLKSSRVDKRTLLEELIAKLALLSRSGQSI